MQGGGNFTDADAHRPTGRTAVSEAGAKAGIRTDGVQLKNQLRLSSPSRMHAHQAQYIQWHLDNK